MKKGLFILSLICLAGILYTAPAKAQEDKDFRFTIKTNPLASITGPVVLLTGEYRILFEVQTLSKQSLQVGIGYVGKSAIPGLADLLDSVNINGYKGSVMYKFFLTGDDAPEGFYVAPYATYSSFKVTRSDGASDDYFKGTKLTFAGVLGYQMISSGGFALDVFTGLGFKNREFSFSNGSTFDEGDFGNKKGMNIAFGFNFGYAF
jgi:hypothetical protein